MKFDFEASFNVGDTFRYFCRTWDNSVEYPILFTYRSESDGFMGCLEPDVELAYARSGKYDVGQVGFTLPVRWYGYPEIYVPKFNSTDHVHSAREYGRRLFDPEAEVWCPSTGRICV